MARSAVLELEHRLRFGQLRSDRPLSSPEPIAANSGWTFTTPYWRSSPSRLAAVIQMKLICAPGAATFRCLASSLCPSAFGLYASALDARVGPAASTSFGHPSENNLKFSM